MKLLALALPMALAACAGQPINRTSRAPLPVASIETALYLGLWREAARLPNPFERDCIAATAEYGLREDGLISVRNACTRADGGAGTSSAGRAVSERAMKASSK